MGGETKTEEELIEIRGQRVPKETGIAWSALLESVEDEAVAQMIGPGTSPGSTASISLLARRAARMPGY